MKPEINETKGRNRLYYISSIIVAVLLAGGIGFFIERETRVVKATYENGTSKEVWVFKGKIIGKKEKVKELTYFRNGNKQSEVEFENGKVNGWARMWYEDGKLHVEGTYKGNKTHGVRNAYHENGKVFCRAEYENGKLMRKKNWDKNGNEIYLPLDRD